MKQCEHCPWRRDADPRQIPGGYDEEPHRGLAATIDQGVESIIHAGRDGLRMMACHESAVGAERPCVGWLAHQLGVGNNLALRIHVLRHPPAGGLELVGEQHRRFEDTLPAGLPAPAASRGAS